MGSLISSADALNLKVRFIRRHDSILAFGDASGLNDVVNDFEYLGRKGWFKDGFRFQMTYINDDETIKAEMMLKELLEGIEADRVKPSVFVSELVLF
jgi:hypothetical protein